MKILMFGRGVIASLYGWALERAGHSVDFYVRPGRAAKYGPTLGLKFLDSRTRLRGELVEGTWNTQLREELPVDHDYELIVVSVQHEQFPEAAAFLGPRVGKATVLVFNNLWSDPQAAASPLPADQLAWGFPMAGGGVDSAGVLKGALLPRVNFGTFGADPTKRELAVRDLFRKSGFGIDEHRDFRGWLWIHFVQNAGILSQALHAGSLQRLTASTAHLKNAVLTTRELFPLLTARGVDLRSHTALVAPYRLPSWLLGLGLRAVFQLFDPVRIVLESHTNPNEMRRICRDVLIEARRLGIAAPRLEALEAFFPEEPGSK